MSSGDVRGSRPDGERQGAMFGVVLATTVAQVGCVTVIVILGALALGLGLDNWLGTRPLFTLVFVLVSIPLSLFLLVRVALSSTQQLAPPKSQQAEEESPDREV